MRSVTPPLDRFSAYRDTSLDVTSEDIEEELDREAEKADQQNDEAKSQD